MILKNAVVPFHPKDAGTLQMCVNSLHEIVGIERVFVLSEEKPTCTGIDWIFSGEQKLISVIHSVLGEDYKRSGWLAQQLLKLIAPKYLNNLYDYDLGDAFLVCDSDVVFLRNPYADVKDGFWPFAPSYKSEPHPEYFRTFRRLMMMDAPIEYSCINHNMVFSRDNIEWMAGTIERRWRCSWFHAILGAIDPKEESGFSEYELYAQMMLGFRDHKCVHVPMRVCEIDRIPSQSDIDSARENGFHILSSQEYSRT